jgi:hypothetical protein
MTSTAVTTYEVKATYATHDYLQRTWECETHEDARETIDMLTNNGWTDFHIFEVTTREIAQKLS